MILSDLINILKSLDIDEIYSLKIEYVNTRDIDKCIELKDLYEN